MRQWLAAAILVLLAPVAAAQQAATLVADSVVVTADARLIAEGNVEVLYDGTRLSAARITYDRDTDRLVIEGPIFIVTGDGAILTARQATLDPQLGNGILLGARLVLDRELQLAASQISRVDGRYSQLYQAAATACRVCGTEEPLWEIRARRVIHDEEARQLWFERAQLRVAGVPILWVPRMRLPDPTLERATGLLVPQIRTTDQLGIGLKLPYFIRLGDHRDLTLTPYLSPRTRTIEAVYRQAYLRGDLVVNAAVSDDDLDPEGLRGYLDARAEFRLPRDFILQGQVQSVSDEAYLTDYGYLNADRLVSEVEIGRIRNDEYIRAAVTNFQTLRPDEDNDRIPSLVGEFDLVRRTYPGIGRLSYGASADTLYRFSSEDVLGRDLSRVGVFADWSAGAIGPAGVIADLQARVDADYFAVAEDPAFDDGVGRVVPAVAATLRWPFVRTGPTGVRDLVEPVVQIAWSDIYGDIPPNEDSTLPEFDGGNLLALNRFPGEDRVETGLRGAVGAQWTRQVPDGWRTTLAFGRVFRRAADPEFSEASGLSGSRSDWLIAAQVDFSENLTVDVRSLLATDGDFTKTTGRLSWTAENVRVDASYVFLPEDADENRDADISEWTLDTSWQVTPAWQLEGAFSYDLVADRPAEAALGIGWQNECVAVVLSVSRQFSTSASVQSTTDFGLRIALTGFGDGRSGTGPSRRCGG